MSATKAETQRRPKTALGALSVAHTVAQAGNTITVFATPFYIHDMGGSAAQVGLATTAATLPIIIGGPLGGVLVDRIGYRMSSVLADVVSALTVLAIAFFGSIGQLSFWALLGLLFISGLFDTPGQSARTVLLPTLARGARVPLERTVGIISGAERIAMLVAAPLGGILVAAIGPAGAFYVDAGLFVSSALLVTALVPRSTVADESAEKKSALQSEGYWRQLKEGLRFVLLSPLLRNVAFIILVLNLFDTARITVLLPLYSIEELEGASATGLVNGALAAGSVLGAALFSVWGHKLPRRGLFVTTFVITGGPLSAAFALGSHTIPLVVVAAATGLASGMLNPLIGTLRLELAPEHMLARVQTLMVSISWAGVPLGSLLAGFVADILDLRLIYAGIGIAYVLVALLPLTSKSWNKVDSRPRQPAS